MVIGRVPGISRMSNNNALINVQIWFGRGIQMQDGKIDDSTQLNQNNRNFGIRKHLLHHRDLIQDFQI